jgi:23S rRNA pseudouridine1911/1915/1917 synthase
MGQYELEILYEDNHLLAINKPAGLATMGLAAGATSLFSLGQQYIKQRYQKPGGVYLGIVSRLDAASSGVVLLARTSKAAARLSARFGQREVEKTYWALLSGKPRAPAGELVDWVVKDEAHHRMVVCAASTQGAKQAVLCYREVRDVGRGSMVEIDLVTGRKHQIRLQFGSRGLPLWGETKYGKGFPFAAGVALHARRLVVPHPVRDELIELVAPVGSSWRALGIYE